MFKKKIIIIHINKYSFISNRQYCIYNIQISSSSTEYALKLGNAWFGRERPFTIHG